MPTLAAATPITMHTLLQAANRNALPTQVLLWVGVLIVLAMLGGAFVMVLRRRMFDRSSDGGAAGSLLEDLRRMRRSGEISEAEFEQARRKLTEKLARSLDAKRQEVKDLRAPTPPPASSARPRSPQSPPRTDPNPGDRHAPPGYDLTGRPLPKPHDPQ